MQDPSDHILRPRRVPRRCAEMPLGDLKRQKVQVLLARSERFELPTPRFEVWCSIQLSYERLIVLSEDGPAMPTAYIPAADLKVI
jgi:hypothetical protein